jgi:bacterioferritin
MENKKSEKAFDLEKIKSQAKISLKDGAVTNGYSLDIEQACENLNMALASEIMCVLRYRHHQVIAKGLASIELAAEFKEHADQEEAHAIMIANRIENLGGDPDFDPSHAAIRSPTEFGSARGLRQMIEEDLIAERIAIEITWFGKEDPTTRRMLESILADEEDHASEFADLLFEEPNRTAESPLDRKNRGLSINSNQTH